MKMSRGILAVSATCAASAAFSAVEGVTVGVAFGSFMSGVLLVVAFNEPERD